jgi:iron complex transport system substrate-binding protein
MLAAWAALALVCALCLAPAAAAQQAPQLTITDDSGVTTAFATPPRRIVSLSPGLTEIVFAVGAGDRLVAVDTFSVYPAEAGALQPRLTTYPAPSLETIVSLQPDLVLSLAERDDDLAAMRQQGIPVLKFAPRDFDATTQLIRTIGHVLGESASAAGEAIADDMTTRRDAVVSLVADAPRPRVYEELDASDPDKPFVAGPNGFYGQIIELAGGTNIFGDLPGAVGQVGAESIIQRDPEIIILTDADLPFNPQTPAMVAARPGWSTIAAVQNGAIYAVAAELYATPGPRLIEGLEAMARVLHPDRLPTAAGRRVRSGDGRHRLPFSASAG